MGFNQTDAEQLIAACHRRCCICHRFCGVKMELDHIVPVGEGGSDEIDNAIPVCFECHAEIHSYNDQHPRGRKFRPNELRLHKKQWLGICANQPQALLEAPRDSSAGPLQTLIDELEFNFRICSRFEESTPNDSKKLGSPFSVRQFHRAMEEGAISVLNEQLKNLIMDAYAACEEINQILSGAVRHAGFGGKAWDEALHKRNNLMTDARDGIKSSLDKLMKFLGHSPPTVA